MNTRDNGNVVAFHYLGCKAHMIVYGIEEMTGWTYAFLGEVTTGLNLSIRPICLTRAEARAAGMQAIADLCDALDDYYHQPPDD